MAFTRSNFSVVAHDFQRETYAAALVGPEAVRHEDLIRRAGYRVIVADDGSAASQLFVGEPVDIIVLDFALTGRPPEAVLLFSRRTSADAPVIAMVPADKDDGYRRAFLAGARDVLPSPARGEDLLASIDVAIEPRALAELVERLRGDEDDDDEALRGETSESSTRSKIDVERVRREYEERVRVLEDDLDSFRRQALDAVTERDRLQDSRANARRRLAEVKKELKEREAHLAMTEQACEALQRKLKDARDYRRRLESRAKELEQRVEGKSPAAAPKSSIDRSITLAPDEVIDALAGGFVDPEEALRVRAIDERRLEQLEDAYAKFQASEARIAELEAELLRETQREVPERAGGIPKEVTVTGAVFQTRSESGRSRQQELDVEIASRLRLEAQVADLERELGAHKSQERRIAELESQLAASEALLHQLDDALGDDEAAAHAVSALALEQEAHAETLGRLDAVTLERDALKNRVKEAEREAADALTRLEELDPLVGEVEQVRIELHAERLRHMATRRLLDQVAIDPHEATAPAELAAAQREEERLQQALNAAHRRQKELEDDLDDARQQMRRLNLEQEQMRMTIAALASDVSRETPSSVGAHPGSGVFLISHEVEPRRALETTHANQAPRPVSVTGKATSDDAS